MDYNYKDFEIQLRLLSRMIDLYDHVNKYGIDRTFVSLYNRHGELNRVCGIQFPACESMNPRGDKYSYYSTRFLAAMEDEKGGFWARVKAIANSLLLGIGQHKKAVEEEDEFEVELRNNIQKLEQKYKSDDALIIAGSITQLFIGNKECETVLSFVKKFTDKLSSVADFSKKMVSNLIRNNSDEARKELSLLNNAIAGYRKLEKETGVLLGKSTKDKYKDKKVRVKVKVITKRSLWYYKEATEISDSLLSAIMVAGTSAEFLERAADLRNDAWLKIDVDTAKLCLASLGSLNNIIYSAQRLCYSLLGSVKTLRKTIANLANA